MNQSDHNAHTSSVFDFSPLAGEYDKWYETAEGHKYDLLEKRAMRYIIGQVEDGKTMLEVGAGTGWWSRFFGGLGYHVTGVDISAEMVETARLKRIPHARFQRADGHRLPFPDHSFSASAAVTSIEFTKDPATVVREMVRCIKSGGSLFLGILNRDAPLNKERQKKGKVFLSARFYRADELYTLLSPYGKPVIRPCAFPLSIKVPRSLTGIADDLQVLLKMSSGALIAARVDI